MVEVFLGNIMKTSIVALLMVSVVPLCTMEKKQPSYTEIDRPTYQAEP
jgi:hypothetical protein